LRRAAGPETWDFAELDLGCNVLKSTGEGCGRTMPSTRRRMTKSPQLAARGEACFRRESALAVGQLACGATFLQRDPAWVTSFNVRGVRVFLCRALTVARGPGVARATTGA
jgi:hypothetical protein